MYRRARLGIGYLPQEASIFRGLNVEDNVRAVLEIAVRRPRASARPRSSGCWPSSASPTCAGRRRWPFPAASGGGSRSPAPWRPARASSCWTSPWPASTRSMSARSATWSATSRIAGLGVLITDHNVRDTLDIIDRAYILHDGAVLREGTPAEIVADPAVRRVYLGERFSL